MGNKTEMAINVRRGKLHQRELFPQLIATNAKQNGNNERRNPWISVARHPLKNRNGRKRGMLQLQNGIGASIACAIPYCDCRYHIAD